MRANVAHTLHECVLSFMRYAAMSSKKKIEGTPVKRGSLSGPHLPGGPAITAELVPNWPSCFDFLIGPVRGNREAKSNRTPDTLLHPSMHVVEATIVAIVMDNIAGVPSRRRRCAES